MDKRGGASGMIGNDLAAKSAPDGYTLTIGTLGPFAVNQSLFSRMPYDPVKDFAPITLTGAASHILVAGFEVRTSMPEWFGDFIKSEAVKWAKVVKEAGIKAE